MAKTKNGNRTPKVYGTPQANPQLRGLSPAPGGITGNIRRTAQMLVKLQTQPQLRALQQQSDQVAVQGKGARDQLTSMYSGLGDYYKGVLGNHDAAASRSADALKGIYGAQSDAIKNQYTAAQDLLGADASVRGPGLDGGTSKRLAAEAAAAQANATGDQTAAATHQQQTQDAYRGLIESMAAAAPTRGAELAGQVGIETAKSMNDIAGKIADVKASRGALLAKTMQDLNQQAFTNYATVQGLNLRGDAQAIQLALGNANLDARTQALNNTAFNQAQTLNQGDRRLDQGDQSLAIRWGNLGVAKNKFKWQQKRAQYIDSHGGLAGLTPYQKAQFQKANQQVRSAIESVGPTGDAFHQQMMKDPKSGKMRHYTQAEIRAALLKQFKNDSDVVNAGIALAHGTLNQHPEIIAALKARHIAIPKSWKVKDTSMLTNGPGR